MQSPRHTQAYGVGLSTTRLDRSTPTGWTREKRRWGVRTVATTGEPAIPLTLGSVALLSVLRYFWGAPQRRPEVFRESR